eukprot:5166332-Amphidinium_carterae.1
MRVNSLRQVISRQIPTLRSLYNLASTERCTFVRCLDYVWSNCAANVSLSNSLSHVMPCMLMEHARMDRGRSNLIGYSSQCASVEVQCHSLMSI